MGNICRSPTAEAVFRAKAQDAGMEGLFEIDSAGTIGYHRGNPADPRMSAHAGKRGYTLTSLARPIVAGDFEHFDLILAMDEENVSDLRAMAPSQETRNKIQRMMDYAPKRETRVVPDPYYGGDAGFERVLDLLEDACSGLLEALRD